MSQSRRKKLRRKLVCGIAVGGVCLAVLVAGRVSVAKSNQKQIESSAEINTVAASKSSTESKIGKVLASDIYGKQLGALYAKYPEVAEIILNREQYPDSLIEYFIGHEEALEWVIDYPVYMAKGEEEINQIALEPVDLTTYYIQKDIPIYYQWDKRWGYASYASGQIAIDGCGPTSLSMVVTGLTGDTSMTPKRIADFSAAEGYYTEEAGTTWTLMTEGAAKLGLQSYQPAWNEEAVRAELLAGHPVICSMGPGDFTDQGHFIVLSGVTKDGTIVVNDPNSQINTRKRWELPKIMEQMKAMWAFSAV